MIVAYLLGSIPFGLLIAKSQGIDLRKVGSGNIGATNCGRALGKKWAYVCFALDVSKGLTPMLMVRLMKLVDAQSGSGDLILWLLVGCCAVAGHIFPIYLRFKGGKGVATSLGIVLGLWPYYTLCGIAVFAVWGVCLLIWRYVSLASIIAAAVFPALLLIACLLVDSWNLTQLWPLLAMGCVMAALIVIRHSSNIKRLMEGTETKIGAPKEEEAI